MLHYSYVICKKCGRKFPVMDGGVKLSSEAMRQIMDEVCPACERKIFVDKFKKRKNYIRKIWDKTINKQR